MHSELGAQHWPCSTSGHSPPQHYWSLPAHRTGSIMHRSAARDCGEHWPLTSREVTLERRKVVFPAQFDFVKWDII